MSFFYCNTCRLRLNPALSSEHILEERMRERGFAAAWEKFNFQSHMARVQKGDLICMFAKGVGIIAVGKAKADCEILQPGDPDRIILAGEEGRSPEWRVPVEWIAWLDDDRACPAPGLNGTFFDLSTEKWAEFRETVREHFGIS